MVYVRSLQWWINGYPYLWYTSHDHTMDLYWHVSHNKPFWRLCGSSNSHPRFKLLHVHDFQLFMTQAGSLLWLIPPQLFFLLVRLSPQIFFSLLFFPSLNLAFRTVSWLYAASLKLQLSGDILSASFSISPTYLLLFDHQLQKQWAS